MKLLLSANTSWYLQNFRAGLINRFLEEGHDIWIMAPPDSSMSSLSAMGCRPIEIAMSGKSTNVFREIRLLLKYFYTLMTIRPDAYISFTIKPVLYGGLVARILDTSCGSFELSQSVTLTPASFAISAPAQISQGCRPYS